MKRVLILLTALAVGPAAWAKLPAPTPEEAAKKQAATEKKVLDDEAAKVALGQAQDKVAVKYRATHKNAPKPVPVIIPHPVKK
jgi:hypothetical protein